MRAEVITKYQCKKCKRIHESEESVEKCYYSHLSSPQDLADVLHEELCRRDHTDRCAYYYEDWDSPGDERNRWLEKAQKVLHFSKRYDVPISELVFLIVHT